MPSVLPEQQKRPVGSHTHSPALLSALPVDGDTWRRRGSMKGVNEEEDLCFGTVGVCERTGSKQSENTGNYSTLQ